MKTSDFDYNLPLERIAQTPAEPRDSSKFMVVDRGQKTTVDKNFFNITEYLGAGDVLVWNNSKVFKARLRGKVMLDETVFPSFQGGGRGRSRAQLTRPHPTLPLKGEESELFPRVIVEVFLVRPMENKFVWKVLAKPGKKLRLGMKVVFARDFVGEVLLKEKDGTILMQFADDDIVVRAKANEYGEVPTPPYIKSPLEGGEGDVGNFIFKNKLANIGEHPPEPPSRGDLVIQYQTVYAKIEGSVAAPTAGFHFTPELIEKLGAKGVLFAEVTLHVGLGTFLPVKTDVVEEHQMHNEWVEITAKNADIINLAKQEGRRVVAVGTTTVRTLEGIAKQNDGKVKSFTGDINIFITPGFKFNIVDALITNFHLPKSTLLMLVAAFVGDRKFTLECYQKAIENQYRFYSFGDAMLIK
jgi:S-adenosylmethionine:tRNA ribosyltransferase-isomerase